MISRQRANARSAQPQTDSAAKYEAALAEAERVKYVLQLYVSGMTPRSQRAIENIRKLCQEHLAGQHELQIIDIYQQPELAKAQQLLAAPTLVKKLPLPLRKFLGDMSDPGRVLVALGLKVEGK